MSTRQPLGTRFKDAEQRKATRARETARLWRLVRAAVRLVDSSKPMQKGVYEISPEAMFALKHQCDEMRIPLKLHDLELMSGEADPNE